MTLGIPKLIIIYLSLDILNISGGNTLIPRTGQFLKRETIVPFKCYIYVFSKKPPGKTVWVSLRGKNEVPTSRWRERNEINLVLNSMEEGLKG